MHSTPFQIHPQLINDCHQLGKLNICHVLLHKNAMMPWFILVPKTSHTDLFAIDDEKRGEILNECKKIADFIKQHFNLTKINFATIGNVVPQLHLHVIGRHKDDYCWPKPVWGNLNEVVAYTESQIDTIRECLWLKK